MKMRSEKHHNPFMTLNPVCATQRLQIKGN